ncbi:armadillo-like helical domain-containing protein 4 isoform X2 [Poeciliopsis prolifica]|uniref:armadillo-like helical domain-containing protein 4 isoform X2 n=1 Tax=Poeciliopsis prolifica TaxID=188132 RepID=UPI00241322D0|nr:armadillo-like helical domain-containing protein 4 isoform X2 [Poeciliopsis prolifica]
MMMMMMSSILQALLLAEPWLRTCGAPTYVPGHSRTQDGSCEELCATEPAPLEKERVTSFMLDVGEGGGTGPDGGPEGIGPVTQARNGVSARGRFGLSGAGRKETESEPEGGDGGLVKPGGPTGGRQQVDADMNTHARTSGSSRASIAVRTDSSYSQESKQGGTDATKPPAFESGQDGHAEATSQASPNAPLWSPKPASLSPVPPLSLVTPRTATRPSAWGHDGPTRPSPPDLLLPEIGPLNMMPRDDGLESLWTEAARPAGDTAVPLPQDEATEATMSSEALPLIFEPFEDATEEGPAGAAAVAAVSRAPAGSPGAMATRLPPTSEADPDRLVNSDADGPSREPPALLSEWTSPWQASGSELLEPVGAGTAASQRRVQTEQEEEHPGTGTVRTTNSEAGTSHHDTITTIASHRLLHKTRTGIEEMESEEELDEDEDNENSEESVEEDSEEDLTEAPETSSTQPPYSLIPPPPVWVQRNQGLMRSWAELIREKAGYVSGMLAPVGIGITGALLIVGALYSIRMLHRKRRNSFKHQRRKARQPEQPWEPGTSCQDQAMLLADSSEDEF